MKTTKTFRGLAVLAVAAVSVTAAAEPVQIDTADPQTGMTQIYSTTFDGPTSQCGPTSPVYCTFFNGEPQPSPPAIRAISFRRAGWLAVSGRDRARPPACSPPTGAGRRSYGSRGPRATRRDPHWRHHQVPTPDHYQKQTVINAGAQDVFNSAPQTAPLDANGVNSLSAWLTSPWTSARLHGGATDGIAVQPHQI
jgi:hypothetical protein